MKNILIIALLSAITFSCSVKPEPLHYTQDACYTCKMTLMDKKFGAEIVTKKGKVYKFDDVNCMINFHNSGFETEDNMAFRLVVDFANPENLINAKDALYVKSEQIKSPMASQVACFANKKDLDQYNKAWKGILMTWGELVTQFK